MFRIAAALRALKVDSRFASSSGEVVYSFGRQPAVLRNFSQRLNRGFNDAINGFNDDGWTLMNNDGADDVIITVNSGKNLSTIVNPTNGLPVPGGVLCVKASMLLQNVHSALLVRFLREPRSEWADYNFDAYSAASLKAGSYGGLRSTRFSGSQVIMPLGHTVESEEMVEIIRLEGHALTQEEAVLTRDIHLLQVETLLDKENYTLEELLDEDEIIQECKALNGRLINFLRERPQVEQLLRYIVEEAPEDVEKRRTFKFPFIACEIFTCEVDIILKTLVEDEELMTLLFSFLKPDHTHSTLLAGYFSKTPAASIGLYVECGSIFETPYSSEATHLLERMAFKSTTNRSHLRIVREVEAIGGYVTASASRGQQCILNVTVREVKDEIEQSGVVLYFFNRRKCYCLSISRAAMHSMLMGGGGSFSAEGPGKQCILEAMHSVAYTGALANPLLAPESAIDRLNGAILEEFVTINERLLHSYLFQRTTFSLFSRMLFSRKFSTGKYFPKNIQPKKKSKEQEIKYLKKQLNPRCRICDRFFRMKNSTLSEDNYCQCVPQFVKGVAHVKCPGCKKNTYIQKRRCCLNCLYVVPDAAVVER